MLFFVCALLVSLSAWRIHASASSSSDSSSAGGCSDGVTKCASFLGDLSHGANVRYGECISQWENPNLQLSSEGLAFWKDLCWTEISLLSGNDIVQGLDEANEYMAAFLTDDLAAVDPFGGRDYWNTILSEDEQTYQPILDNPSIYIFPNVDTCSTRGFLPSASDVLLNNAEYPKYRPYRGYHIEKQGLYTLEDWNKAQGYIELECYEDGKGRIDISVQNLMPYVPYTIWGVFGITDYPSDDKLTPIEATPLGGVPNAFYADNNGDATADILVPFCPLDTYDPLMYIALLGHWDFVVAGASYGADRPVSVTSADHVVFNVGDYVY